MKRIAALLAILWASPLAAQGLTIDGHLIDRCLAVRKDGMQCVGMRACGRVQGHGAGSDMVHAGCFRARCLMEQTARQYFVLRGMRRSYLQ